jgi:hypothetical protein
MYSVYQNWDPLKVCIVGRSYQPEFYSWITVPHVRNLFEKIAIETEEDYQGIIKKLQEFDVEILRPNIPNIDDCVVDGRYLLPPMTPRDYTAMIGDVYYSGSRHRFDFANFYKNVKDSSWPKCYNLNEFYNLPNHIQRECAEVHHIEKFIRAYSLYDHIDKHISQQGNTIKKIQDEQISGAMISRIGQDLYFGTVDHDQDQVALQKYIDQEFTSTRNHIINTGGHVDGTFYAMCPGLIVSTKDIPMAEFRRKFPDWEVLYVDNSDCKQALEFKTLKEKNKGRWWIPGFEHDHSVIDIVETNLTHWAGNVQETIFDVNMVMLDPKNVMICNHNQQIFDVLDRYGITPHVVPFRHRHFWDGALSCMTSDLHREGTRQNLFPDR